MRVAASVWKQSQRSLETVSPSADARSAGVLKTGSPVAVSLFASLSRSFKSADTPLPTKRMSFALRDATASWRRLFRSAASAFFRSLTAFRAARSASTACSADWPAWTSMWCSRLANLPYWSPTV